MKTIILKLLYTEVHAFDNIDFKVYCRDTKKYLVGNKNRTEFTKAYAIRKAKNRNSELIKHYTQKNRRNSNE